MKWAAGEYNISEKKSPGTKAETSRKLDDGIEAQKIGESWTETKKRGSEDEIESKVEMKNKGGFEGGRFLGRKKVLHLASSPSTSDGGTDSPGATSPSPTKITPSPQRKESESSGQDYSL